MTRNLARFTDADAAEIIGRALTEGEYRALVKTLEHSSLGEVFIECVNAVINEESACQHVDGWDFIDPTRPDAGYTCAACDHIATEAEAEAESERLYDASLPDMTGYREQ